MLAKTDRVYCLQRQDFFVVCHPLSVSNLLGGRYFSPFPKKDVVPKKVIRPHISRNNKLFNVY